jgi:hypothetical protein
MPTSATSTAVGPVSAPTSTGGVSNPPDPIFSPPIIRDPVAPTIDSCGLGGIRFYQSYYWKFIVTNLNCETLTSLDRLAMSRRVTYTFEEPTEISMIVPSDNVRVNLLHTDGDTKVDEGVRIVFGFRHEGTGEWTCRAAGLIMQIHDTGEEDVSSSEIIAWDPWRYLDFLPIINAGPDYLKAALYAPTGRAQSQDEIEMDTVGDVIIDQLTLALTHYANPFGTAGLFIDWGQTPYYAGTWESVPLPHRYGVAAGTSIGEMLRELSQDKDNGGRDYCDIVLTPVYDPVNRPGIIAELNLFAPNSGATLYDTVFSWGRFPNTLTSADRLKDGTQRSNNILFYASRDGVPVSLKQDTTSQAKYRTYYKSKYFPTQGGNVEVVEDLASAQLILRANGIETITVNPTPERGKVPLRDYVPGDVVNVAVSRNMRRESFDMYRVLQIPIEISDEALETVTSLTLKKVPPRDLYGPFYGPNTVIVSSVGETGTWVRTRSTQTSLPGP